MSNLKFQFLTTNNGLIEVPIEFGKVIYVLGANGTGKSILMHNVYSQHKGNTKRILAHRRTWFTTNAMNMTAQSKKQTEEQIHNANRHIQTRWRDDLSEQRSSMSIFDLINSENIRAREIAKAVDTKEIDKAILLSNIQAPIIAINELLAIANIPIIISLGQDEQLFASKNGSEPYSIAELSDGERNALLIASDVLTAPPNTLIIVDEPERHLHRSIISPLLSSLFEKKRDCAFIISTHDVLLPTDNDYSTIILLRGCQWKGKSIQNWDADIIQNNNDLPEIIKHEILGSKRKIMFVEGDSTSLDKLIYQLIYPSISVQPLGDCSQIERAIDGILQTKNLHWLEAYGLVDADDRTPEQITKLQEKGIIALPCYSVESLYYNIEIIEQVALKYAELIEKSSEELVKSATSNIIPNLVTHKERLCARLSERKARKRVMSSLPKHREILMKGDFEIKFSLKEVLEEEEKIFDKLVNTNDLNALIDRYPIRETPVINTITSAFGFDRKTYESMVRKLIINSPAILKLFKTKLQGLTNLINK
jgi:ABC-type cobalamin/Fe3+-siderophores transport system ATPase subunit